MNTLYNAHSLIFCTSHILQFMFMFYHFYIISTETICPSFYYIQAFWLTQLLKHVQLSNHISRVKRLTYLFIYLFILLLGRKTSFQLMMKITRSQNVGFDELEAEQLNNYLVSVKDLFVYNLLFRLGTETIEYLM